MFIKNSPGSKVTGLLLTGALLFSLSGCANPVDKLIEKGTQAATGKAIEAITGGEAEISGTKIPKDFPKEVPLPNGKLITSMRLGESYQLLYEGNNTVTEAYTVMLLAADYEEESFIEADQGFLKAFSGPTGWVVGVTGNFEGDENVLALMVYKNE